MQWYSFVTAKSRKFETPLQRDCFLSARYAELKNGDLLQKMFDCKARENSRHTHWTSLSKLAKQGEKDKNQAGEKLLTRFYLVQHSER